MPTSPSITHTGDCHCGRVRFEVVAPARIEVMDCDCSICLKSGHLHLIVRSRLQAPLRCGRPDHLRVQHENRETPVLVRLRHQGVLCAALPSGRLQRQRALPR